ncbi:MAG: methionine gamma-lyase family protein [Candidatus Carbobacillus altaicus]|nr:methionine gamma-lyase family protein [Candidatus Carbobacillus altaicus]
MTQVSQEGIEGIGQEGARLSQATLDEIRSRLFRQAKARRLGFQALYTNTRRAAIRQFLTHLEDALYPLYRSIESLEEHHTERILSAFRRHRVMNIHFNPSTGYGYHDLGRETLENVYAAVWGGEMALVRQHFVSGTHTLTVGLFALLRPGDELLIATGMPYDTLQTVLGLAPAKIVATNREAAYGHLQEWGISVRLVPLKEDGSIDLTGVMAALRPNTRVLYFQRSRGYEARPSLFVREIALVAQAVKKKRGDIWTFVDNCYGEFVEDVEPTELGVDVIAGSLIKNPGGGLAKSGGYILGKKEAVERAAHRLSAPGLGGEAGAHPGGWLDLYQGFFLAPHVVAEAKKGAELTALALSALGYHTDPLPLTPRTDLIQAVEFQEAGAMIRFIQGIQKASPIDAHVTPVPGEMPGYTDPVIMAAGTFVQGGSLELTADGPLRPPYRAYIQGGLTRSHIKQALTEALSMMLDEPDS